MRQTLLRLAEANGGVVTRVAALAHVPRHVLDDAVTAGALIRVFPGVFVLPHLAADPRARRRAALAYRLDVALSHTDALEVWGLPRGEPAGGVVHLTCSATRTNVEVPGVQLHRRVGFDVDSGATVTRDGLRVVRIEQAIVESWRYLPRLDRRAPAIIAVRERRTTASRLADVLARQPRAAGAREMRQLFDLLGAGCHSELEIWGHERVFRDRRLPLSKTQVPVPLPTGVVYLDRLYQDAMLNVELDGAAYHGAAGQRERDIIRDARLAALGFLTVRYSHQRLYADPGGVIGELLDILAMRTAQLGRRAIA